MECKVDFISICENSAWGDGNTQDLKCYRSGCENRSGDTQTTSSNTHNTFCANSNSCLNDGINTKVIANGASHCESDGPDTTVCQPGRKIVTPNS
jgi:hypothetical protein